MVVFLFCRKTEGGLTLVSGVFNTIGSVITGFMSNLSTAITGAVDIVWDGSALTEAGILFLIPVGVGVVYFGYRLITGLLRRA